MAEGVKGGREAFRRRDWSHAFVELSAADGESPLEPAGLERLAVAAYLTGRDAESEQAWTRAHSESLGQADWGRAARCAFWLGITLMNRMEQAKGGGWLARAQRVLDDAQHECVERGWLLVALALRQAHKGEFESSAANWAEAAKIGARYNDEDLVTTARQGEGRTLIYLGKTDEGVALLDEAMVAVAAGEISPIPAGIVYCSVIEACHEILDVRRAQEWTKALTDWCASQPDLVPYRGRCLIHRSEIMQLNGAWPDAIEEARRACERLSEPRQPQLGAAFYQRAELHRLRGEFAKAEDAYREASHRGRLPEPGLALLRLAQGRADVAAVQVRRAVDEARHLVGQSKVLPAYVEIMLATKDIGAARAAADELSAIAESIDTAYVSAVADHAQGAVLLAEGDTGAALQVLRRAWASFEELQVPYEAARARLLAGLACRQLGDEDGAVMEHAAARRVFEELGASPDLARLDVLSGTEARVAAGLTVREVQVLALVARGRSNKEIAAELVISDRTVARHMSNIFVKLGVSTRTGASAFAFEHHLV